MRTNIKNILLFVIVVLMLLFTVYSASAVDQQWWNSSWLDRKEINITYNGATNLTDFPAFIKIIKEDVEFPYQFNDLRFFSGACLLNSNTQLNYEIDRGNTLTGEGEIWVNIPLMTNNTQVCMYYNNQNVASGQNVTGVWDANYGMVQHLESIGSVPDSTSNGNNGTNVGATAASGIIGGAYNFNGVNQRVTVPFASSIDLSRLTTWQIEAWVNTDVLAGTLFPTVFAQGFGRAGLFLTDFTAGTDGRMESWINDVNNVQSNTAVTNGNWAYVILTYTQGGTRNFYFNGIADGNALSVPVLDANENFGIGNYYTSTTDSGLDGTIDELRVSKVVRSTDWNLQSYRMVANQASYVISGAEETYTPSSPQLPVINTFTASNGTILNGSSTTLSWNVSYATNLDLNGINLTGNTSLVVSPMSASTLYTLTATNENGTVNSNLTITTYQQVGMLPNATSFNGASTDFNSVPDLNSVAGAVLENTSVGKISFNAPVNVSGADLDTYVYFAPNLVGIDSNAIPGLNVAANLTMYTTDLNAYATVYRNGVPCGAYCSNIVYDGSELTFTATGFSNYTGVNGTIPINCSVFDGNLEAGTYNLNESCTLTGYQGFFPNVTLNCNGNTLTLIDNVTPQVIGLRANAQLNDCTFIAQLGLPQNSTYYPTIIGSTNDEGNMTLNNVIIQDSLTDWRGVMFSNAQGVIINNLVFNNVSIDNDNLFDFNNVGGLTVNGVTANNVYSYNWVFRFSNTTGTINNMTCNNCLTNETSGYVALGVNDGSVMTFNDLFFNNLSTYSSNIWTTQADVTFNNLNVANSTSAGSNLAFNEGTVNLNGLHVSNVQAASNQLLLSYSGSNIGDLNWSNIFFENVSTNQNNLIQVSGVNTFNADGLYLNNVHYTGTNYNSNGILGINLPGLDWIMNNVNITNVTGKGNKIIVATGGTLNNVYLAGINAETPGVFGMYQNHLTVNGLRLVDFESNWTDYGVFPIFVDNNGSLYLNNANFSNLDLTSPNTGMGVLLQVHNGGRLIVNNSDFTNYTADPQDNRVIVFNDGGSPLGCTNETCQLTNTVYALNGGATFYYLGNQAGNVYINNNTDNTPPDPCADALAPGAAGVLTQNCTVTAITPNAASSVLDCQGNTITNTVASGGLIHTSGNNLEFKNCNVISMVGTNTLGGGYNGATIKFQDSTLTTNRAVEMYGGNQVFIFNNSILDFTGAPGYATCGGSVNIYNSVATNFGSADWCGNAPFNVFDSNLTYSGSGGPPLGGASLAVMRRNRILVTGNYSDLTGYWGGSFTFEDNFMDNQGQIGSYNASAEDFQDVGAYVSNNFGGGNPYIVRNNVFTGNPIYGNMMCMGGTPSELSQITGNDIQWEVKDSIGGECTGGTLLGVNVSNNNYTYMPRFWPMGLNGTLDLTGKIFEYSYTTYPFMSATFNQFPMYGGLNKVKDDVNVLVEFDTPAQFTGQTAYDFIKVGRRTIYINSSVVNPGSGRITFANTGIASSTNLTILKDGVVCTTCTNITVGSVKRWWYGSTNHTMNATTVSFETSDLSGNYTVGGICDIFDGNIEAGIYDMNNNNCLVSNQTVADGVEFINLGLTMSGSTLTGSINFTNSVLDIGTTSFASKPRMTNSTIVSSGNTLNYYSVNALSQSVTPLEESNVNKVMYTLYNVTGYVTEASSCNFNMDGYTNINSTLNGLSGNIGNCSGAVSIPYYVSSGLHDMNITLVDAFGQFKQAFSAIVSIDVLDALRPLNTSLSFGFTPNSSGVLYIKNTGNTPFTNISMTTYNLPGSIVPAIVLAASNFRMGQTYNSAIPLIHGVPVYTNLTVLPTQSNSTYIYLTVPQSQYPQQYTSTTPWQVTVN